MDTQWQIGIPTVSKKYIYNDISCIIKERRGTINKDQEALAKDNSWVTEYEKKFNLT